jgi:hypothetical protein
MVTYLSSVGSREQGSPGAVSIHFHVGAVFCNWSSREKNSKKIVKLIFITEMV